MSDIKNNNKSKSIKPCIKWSGGKSWAKNFIIDFFKANEKSTLVEPFAGGIAATLSTRPKTAVINDINPHLINFYKQVRRGLALSIPLENSEGRYLEHRQRFNALISIDEQNTSEAAQLFYYLNKTGFNGLCRFNKKGLFNTPFGRYENINYQIDFSNLKEIFKDYTFLCTDFENINTKKIGADALYFIDSPYDDSFTGYSKEGFDWDDQLRLIDWASKLENPVLMTNKATDRIMEELKSAGFTTKIVKKKHTVGASGASRKVIDEVFAWKNAKLPENYPLEENWRQIMKGKK